MSKIFDAVTVKVKWATVKKVIAKKSNHTYASHLVERYNMFDTFAQHEFHLSKRYGSFAELSKAAHVYQMFVVGSDQLWLPSNIAANY